MIDIDKKRDQIIGLLRIGVSKTRIARNLGIGRTTLYRYMLRNPINEDELGVSNRNMVEKPLPASSESDDVDTRKLDEIIAALNPPKD